MSNGGGIIFSINNLTSIEFDKEEERGRPFYNEFTESVLKDTFSCVAN